jgi:hypothetical protein
MPFTLYFVVRKDKHTWDYQYVSHPDLASASAEALRLSRKEPNKEFLVLEAKALGKVVNQKMLGESDG